MLLYVLLACMSDTGNSPEWQATELLRNLFSNVFALLFGNIVRKLITASTMSETRRPNERPNRMKTTRARFVGRSLAVPPPAQAVTKVGRCSPIPPSQRLDGGIGKHLQLKVQQRGAGWPTTSQVKTGIGWARTEAEGPVSVSEQMEREEREQEGTENKNGGEEFHLLRLTRRDKELLAHVSVARYLTGEQLRRLVFSGKKAANEQDGKDPGKRSSAVVCRRRLKGLCSERSGAAYLRRLSFRDTDNKPVAVFAATTLGYGVAAQFLRRAVWQPAADVTNVVLARIVRLNELYLALAQGRTAAHAPFAWTASHATDLPSWEEPNVGRGRVEKRRLAPDAIVELLAERTRVFVADEMGVGPLPRSAENARAWALSRLSRYASLMMTGGDHSLYAQKYPDHWKAELVLLADSEERASNLAQVIAGWQKVNQSVPLVVRALTMRQAAGLLRGRLPDSARSEPEIPIKRSELRLACAFTYEVLATFKAVRHFLRANPALRAQGCPYPEYSPQFEGMIALVERLQGEMAGSR